jgi:hypothetical protein
MAVAANASEQFRPVMAGAANAEMTNGPWPLYNIAFEKTRRRLD